MKRNILWILTASLFITVLVVAGCAPATPAPTEAPVEAEPTEASATEVPAEAPTEAPVELITIQIFYPVAVDAPIAAIFNEYIAEFEAANPDIHVEPVFWIVHAWPALA